MVRRAWAIIAATAICAGLAGSAAAAVPNPGGSYPDDLWLARHFRPELFFDSQERWRPLAVDRFLAEPGHQACPQTTVPPTPCVPLTSVAQLTPAVDHLDPRGDGPGDEPGPSAIYAHVVRAPDPTTRIAPKRIAIDYWWFLRFNAWSLDRHEGDWEGVTVIVDPFGRRVRAVHFAAHADAWRYPAGVPLIDGRRVQVFVARGDHASYPRPCHRRCRQTEGTLPEARFDGKRPWAGNTAAGCRGGRCVRLFPTGPDGLTPASWAAWDGRWGVTTAPAFAAPLTPAFQRRFQHPFAARRSPRDLF